MFLLVAENQLFLLLLVEKKLESAHRHRNLLRQMGRNQAGLVIINRHHSQSRMIINQKFRTLC
jgi:hypothetical protein